MKRIVIIGATSGIGKETALLFARRGWRVGAAGRRENLLMQLKASMPAAFETQVLDATATDAPEQLDQLIRKLGGMDVFLLCSGIGTQNPSLQPEPELHTATTNVGGFIRMTTAAFNYFKAQGGGHLAAITSIAGTKGLGIAPAYSATKRFQNTYLDALAQLARMQHLHIRVTDIRPGFVDTDLPHDHVRLPRGAPLGKGCRAEGARCHHRLALPHPCFLLETDTPLAVGKATHSIIRKINIYKNIYLEGYSLPIFSQTCPYFLRSTSDPIRRRIIGLVSDLYRRRVGGDMRLR